jgi:8-oxo-dGTP pyrophosphatase MutT (NUDIX family)
MTANPFKTKSSRIVYQNPWMKVREDQIIHPAGHAGIYAYLDVKDSVVVIARNSEQQIFFVKKFAYPTKAWLWELPGGGGETDEEITDTARRELAEETGLASDDWRVLGKSVVYNGLSSEWQYSLLAERVIPTEQVKSDDKNEIADGKFFSQNEIHKMIRNGEIADCQTLAALRLLYVVNDASEVAI